MKKTIQLITFIFALSYGAILFAGLSQSVFCPPHEAVHCTNGICSLDTPYPNNWRLFVTGSPNGSPFFTGVLIQNPPSTAICQYGYTQSKRFLTLNSLKNYSPDLNAPGNQWVRYGEIYVCEDDLTTCPLLS